MSMLDALFKKAFNASKCKTLLKLTIPRIKLLRNRREIQLKQMRRDIAKLLETGQEATARIRVEHIIREENMMAAQEIMELFCELISVRLPIIETQRECPLDLKEAISSICFAAPRCSDLPELQQVQMLFAAKYGKEFVAAATELMPDCGVNRQIIELLSIRAPSAEVKLKLLKEIAEEHEIEWDPAGSESEFLKSHEDLLNGPSQFISGSKFPLPKEKHEDSLSSTPAESFHEQSDSDPGIDTLDLPEVPKVSLRPSSNSVSAPETVPSSQVPPNLESDNEIAKSLQTKVDSSYELHSEHDVLPEPSAAFPYTPSNTSVDTREDKQFLPFMSPPSFSSGSFSVKQSEPAQALPRTKIEDDDDFQNVFTTNQAGASSTSFSVKQSEPEPARVFSRTKSDGSVDFQNVFTATQAGDSSTTFSVKQGEPVPSFSRTKSEANVDLHDVLAAARAAAESAECAAASARSAASLAEVRITELLKNRNSIPLDSSESTPHLDGSYVSSVAETLMTNRQQSFVDTVGVSHSVNPLQEHRSFHGSDSPNPTSLDTPKTDFKATDFEEQIPEHHPAHQPQRLTSLEDDSYFSYPNLFSRQDSNLRSGVHASVNNSPSEHRPE